MNTVLQTKRNLYFTCSQFACETQWRRIL